MAEPIADELMHDSVMDVTAMLREGFARPVPLRRRPWWRRVLRAPTVAWRIYRIQPEQPRHLRAWRAWLVARETTRWEMEGPRAE